MEPTEALNKLEEHFADQSWTDDGIDEALKSLEKAVRDLNRARTALKGVYGIVVGKPSLAAKWPVVMKKARAVLKEEGR